MKPANEHSPNRKLSIVRGIGRHLRGNLIAYLALFLALSGSAYALERSSVGTKHLKKSAVRSGKIANQAVTSTKLKDGSVTAGKLANGAVGRDKITAAAIDTAKLAPGAVDTGRVANGAITREKLAPGAVSRDQLGLVSARVDVDDTSTNEGGTVKDIYTHGPFTIRVRCTMKNNGWTWFSAFVRSSEQATSLALAGHPYYRLEANEFRSVASQKTMNGGGTTAFPVNVWSKSGRYLQVSVIATSRTYAAKDDCSYLVTGFAG